MYMREPEEELNFTSYPGTLVVGLVLAAIGVLTHRHSAIAHAHPSTKFSFLIVRTYAISDESLRTAHRWRGFKPRQQRELRKS